MSAFLLACHKEKKDGPVVAPWGEVKQQEIPKSDNFTLDDIVSGGEMIMLTLSGPGTYYEYHGRELGAHFMLCQRFAKELGVSLRVELCRDTLEMVDKLKAGRGDVAAFPLPKGVAGADSLDYCGMKSDSLGVAWAVRLGNEQLAKALNEWYRPEMLDNVRREEKRLLATPKVRRHVFSPFLNRRGGIISKYDALFQKYAPVARWDWRLMAAQCYQESCFDPNARSWAGAQGLMQIMPKTAAHLGLKPEEVNDPEKNIRAAAQLIKELTESFSDVKNVEERKRFVLASYNGGSGHIRDAMALTTKQGGNPQRWADVAERLLLLREPEYYNDPVVKHGYIRSTETHDYVELILERYKQYRRSAPLRR